MKYLFIYVIKNKNNEQNNIKKNNGHENIKMKF